MKILKYFPLCILLFLLTSSCQSDDESQPSVRNKLLFLEEKYFQNTEEDPYEVISYQYDEHRNLIKKSQNELFITEYTYDAFNQLELETFGRIDEPKSKTFYFYPSINEKIEIKIAKDSDTTAKYQTLYNEDNLPINEKTFLYPNPSNNRRQLEVSKEIEYSYSVNGRLESSETTFFQYRENKVIGFHKSLSEYDERGNIVKESAINSALITEHITEFTYIYDGDLLIESFVNGRKEYTYRMNEYDLRGRLTKTFNYNGYLLSERIYEKGRLKELHSYFANSIGFFTPSFLGDKTITVYTYR